MEKLTKASSCPNMLLSTKLDLDKVIGADGDGAGTVKLNANAHEFVPRDYKKGEETNSSSNSNSNSETVASKYPNPNAQEFVPRQKEASTQVNAEYDEDLEPLKDENVMQWQDFPTFPIKVGNGLQMVLLNHTEYMLVPCLNSAKNKIKKQDNRQTSSDNGEEIGSTTSSSETRSFAKRLRSCENKRKAAYERRRDHQRKVAVEALKLVEQRRGRSPLVPNNNNNGEGLEPPKAVIHLTRSPVRYTDKERLAVDHLKHAKGQRVEKILREMSEERKQQQLQQKKDSSLTSSPPPSTSKPARRYIPTAKEWDEHRRAKAKAKRQAKRKARREARREAQQKGKSSSSMESPMEKTKENPKENPKNPKENPKENPKVNPKVNLKENPMEIPKENSKENTKENPKENPKENTKENPKENSNENLMKNPMENPIKNPKENSKENPKENPKENSMESIMESSKEIPTEMPMGIPMEMLVELPMELPMEGFMEVPLQNEGGELIGVQRPNATPGDRPPTGNSNVTNWPTQVPQNFEKGKFTLRYTIQELQQMGLAFKDLKMPCLEKKFQGMGFLNN